MNFAICNSFCSTDALFQCFFSNNKNNVVETQKFTLIVDKRLSTYPFDLYLERARVTVIDTNYEYLCNYNITKTLPPLFICKNIKGKRIEDAIHEDVVTFYKNIVKTTYEKNKAISLHVILNGKHILLITHPMYDNRNKIMACTLIEIPYSNIENFR
jgi:hypothetical protein